LNPKLERAQTRKVVEEWQGNLLNCCGIEFGAAFVRATTIIVTMQNGANSFEFAKMMRESKQCYSYKVEKVIILFIGKIAPKSLVDSVLGTRSFIPYTDQSMARTSVLDECV